jgi:hypothetical protein
MSHLRSKKGLKNTAVSNFPPKIDWQTSYKDKILDRWEVFPFKETPGTKSDCGPLYAKECNQNGAHQIQQKNHIET